VINGGVGGIRALAFSRDGAILAAGGWGRSIGLWDVATQTALGVLKHEQHDPTGLAFAGDGRRLYSSGWDGTAMIWDVGSRTVLFASPQQSLPLTSIALAPDEQTFATSSGNWKEPARPGEVKLWKAADGQEVATFAGHEAMIYSVRYTSGGDLLYSIGRDRSLRTWNVAERSAGEVHSLPGGGSAFALVPDTTLAIVSQGSAAIAWDLAAKRKLRDLGTHSGNIYDLVLSPDGKSVATASQDRTVRRWSVETGSP
jgi:WD40 repeat protein